MTNSEKKFFILFSTNKFSHLQFSQIIKEFKVTVDFVNHLTVLPVIIQARPPIAIFVIQNQKYDIINNLRRDPNLDTIPVIVVKNSKEGSKLLSLLMKFKEMELGSDQLINIGKQLML